jgi:hypothetical protein
MSMHDGYHRYAVRRFSKRYDVSRSALLLRSSKRSAGSERGVVSELLGYCRNGIGMDLDLEVTNWYPVSI